MARGGGGPPQVRKVTTPLPDPGVGEGGVSVPRANPRR